MKVVLMEPLPRENPVWLGAKQDEWKKRLKKDGQVEFGDPELEVSHGLTLSQTKCGEKLAHVAKAAVTGQDGPLGKCEKKLQPIDPRYYGEVALHAGSAEDLPGIKRSLEQIRGLRWAKIVVVYGAAFGNDDRFLTPAGPRYGVEVHAAATASLLDQESVMLERFKEPLALLLDVLFALALGVFISACWRWYFRLRLSSDANRRQAATLVVAALILTVIVLAFAVALASVSLYVNSGVWLSPLPIAIGMLIDSFVSGSVTEALAQLGARRPPPTLKNFVVLDVLNLWNKGRRWAALIVSARRTAWLAVVSYAVTTAVGTS
jgi:multisubunit Na+/H+ antiporter MnhC subunit